MRRGLKNLFRDIRHRKNASEMNVVALEIFGHIKCEGRHFGSFRPACACVNTDLKQNVVFDNYIKHNCRKCLK